MDTGFAFDRALLYARRIMTESTAKETDFGFRRVALDDKQKLVDKAGRVERFRRRYTPKGESKEKGESQETTAQ